MRTIAQVDQDQPENIINDGKADPRGRLITGKINQFIKKINQLIANYYKDTLNSVQLYLTIVHGFETFKRRIGRGKAIVKISLLTSIFI